MSFSTPTSSSQAVSDSERDLGPSTNGMAQPSLYNKENKVRTPGYAKGFAVASRPPIIPGSWLSLAKARGPG